MGEIDLRELGARLREYREGRNLSMRAAAEESGAPLNTISRVERGQMPDLANFKRLAEWIGLDPALFFAPSRTRQESTPQAIRHLLRQDPHLSEQATEQIASLVESLYGTLVTPSGDAGEHVQAASTFTPTAAERLGGVLATMRSKLATDEMAKLSPGWA